MSDAQQTVKQIYSALAAGDVASFAGLVSPDLLWNEAEGFPYADRNPYKGPEAVVAGVLGRIGEEWSDFAIDVGEIVGGQEVVTMFGRYRGTCVATGKSLDAQCSHTWWLKDGKAVRFQQMVDTQAVAQAAS